MEIRNLKDWYKLFAEMYHNAGWEGILLFEEYEPLDPVLERYIKAFLSREGLPEPSSETENHIHHFFTVMDTLESQQLAACNPPVYPDTFFELIPESDADEYRTYIENTRDTPFLQWHSFRQYLQKKADMPYDWKTLSVTTEHLVLRPLIQQDTESVYSFLPDMFSPWNNDGGLHSGKQACDDFVQNSYASWLMGNPQKIQFAVAEKDSGAVVGCVLGDAGYGMDDGVYITAVIHADCRCKGYGEEATAAALTWMKDHFETAGFYTRVAESNIAGQKIAARCGIMCHIVKYCNGLWYTENMTLEGNITGKLCNRGSKSESIQYFLTYQDDKGDRTVELYYRDDNPFENSKLSGYVNKRCAVRGTFSGDLKVLSVEAVTPLE